MARMYFIKPSRRHNVTPTIVTNSAATGYSVASLNDGSPARPLLFNAAGAIRLQWDLGSALAVGFVAIFNHNIEAADTITIQANTAASWGSPAQSAALTRNGAASPDGYRPNTWGIPSWAATPYRYWSIVTAGSSAAAIQIGEIWLATGYDELPTNPAWGLRDSDVYPPPTTFVTKAGVEWMSTAAGRRRRLSGVIPDADDAGLVTIQDWFRDCYGREKPTILVPNPDGGGSLTYQDDARLVRWDSEEFSRDMSFLNLNGMPVGWTELARG